MRTILQQALLSCGKRCFSRLTMGLLTGLMAVNASAQQFPDTAYTPPPFEARYPAGTGPAVHIDEAHHNFHTRTGNYSPFARVLESDGYVVKSHDKPFSWRSLRKKEILVIANALPDHSGDRWIAPTRSAFTQKEIRRLNRWVKRGGSLFLVADHMPFGGAAADLAASFGFTFYDGFADDSTTLRPVELFSKQDNSLGENKLTSGRPGYFGVDSVSSFTGQVFGIPKEATSILNCGDGWMMAMPDTAWVFTEGVKILNASGFSQGAFQRYGKGKIAVFGEAAMFSAQIAMYDVGSIKVGMNNADGRNNYRLLLNIIRWLDDE